MLHKKLNYYLKEIDLALSSLSEINIDRYLEEVLTPTRVNLRIRIRWQAGYLLEINEAIMIEDNAFKTLDYRYHCQDSQNNLIFRYDGTPHFPNLSENFPHHKHCGQTVIACVKPEIIQVLQEVTNLCG